MKSVRLLIILLVVTLIYPSSFGTNTKAVTEDKPQAIAESSSMLGTTDLPVLSEPSDTAKQLEGNLAEGEFGNSSWHISNDFTLIIEAGEFADTNGISPWINYQDKIHKIRIDSDVVLGRESSNLFQGLSKLVEINGLENLKILNSTKIDNFFKGCTELKALDFSNWNTKNIIRNDSFLSDCIALETIELGPYSIFQEYEDEDNLEQSVYIWKGQKTSKEFNSLSNLLSNNDRVSDVFFKISDSKISEISIKYLNEEEKEIHESKKLSGEAGTNYDIGSQEYQLKISGYLIDETQLPEAKGIFLETDQTIIFHYKKIATQSKQSDQIPSVFYRTHVNSLGWQNFVQDGMSSGTVGQGKSVEAIEIKLDGVDTKSEIEYRTHIQDIGWEKQFAANGDPSGAAGKTKQLEAIQIRLKGDIAGTHDVFYRVYSQTFGWLDWAKNGESAGTEGCAYRMESIEVKLIEKGSNQLVSEPNAFIELPLVSYRTHVQLIGWQNYVKNGQTAGTSGQNRSLEAIQIQLKKGNITGDIQYRTHVQYKGWESTFKSDNVVSGTTGQAKNLEAIQIKLSGEIAQKFDVYYRVYSQTFGWLGWAKNGDSAGTEGLNFRMESLQIKILPKESTAIDSNSKAFIKSSTVSYRAHTQEIGWQNPVKDGQTAGTIGQSKRLEAIQVQVGGGNLSGGIQYKTHIQYIGWEPIYKFNNTISGTTGQGKRLEAIQIQLTGEIAEFFDVYYRAHSQTFGWLSWAKNGESAGTEGISCRLESIQIRIIPKGSNELKTNPKAFIRASTVSYRTNVQSIGWQNYVKNGQISGTSGQKKRLEAIQLQLEKSSLTGGIQYRTHIQNNGWESSFRYDNSISGTTGQAKRLEAIQIQLFGEVAKYYDVYYRVHSQNFGWLGWAKNGISAGTESYSYRMEAIQIKLIFKGNPPPTPSSNPYMKKPLKPTVSTFLGTTRNRIVNDLQSHQNDWHYQTTPFKGNLINNAEVMSPRGNPTIYGPGMNCTGFVAYVLRKGGGQLSAITRISNQYGGAANGYNWRNALVPNVQYHSFRTVSELVKSGKASKGDVIYFEPNFSLPNPDCHLGFFWGDNPYQDRIWHSTFPANKISNIYSATPYSKVLLFKL